MPGARGSLLRGLPLLAHHSRRRHRPLLLLFIAVPIFLHRRRRAPTDLDLDGRFLPTQGCYRLPRLKGVGLSGARLVVRHPHDRGLSIREDAGPCRACVAWPVPLPLPMRARWPSNASWKNPMWTFIPAHLHTTAYPTPRSHPAIHPSRVRTLAVSPTTEVRRPITTNRPRW